MDYPLGPTGLWTGSFEALTRSEVRETVAEIEELGWSAVWIPETIGRESLTSATLLLQGGHPRGRPELPARRRDRTGVGQRRPPGTGG